MDELDKISNEKLIKKIIERAIEFVEADNDIELTQEDIDDIVDKVYNNGYNIDKIYTEVEEEVLENYIEEDFEEEEI